MYCFFCIIVRTFPISCPFHNKLQAFYTNLGTKLLKLFYISKLYANFLYRKREILFILKSPLHKNAHIENSVQWLYIVISSKNHLVCNTFLPSFTYTCLRLHFVTTTPERLYIFSGFAEVICCNFISLEDESISSTSMKSVPEPRGSLMPALSAAQ